MIGVLHKTFSDNVADARINQLKPVLQDMNKFMENITSTSSIKGCLANYVKLEGYEGMKSPKDVASLLDEIAASGGGPDAPQKFIKTTIPTAPCGGKPGCCQHNVYLRPNTTDYQVFKQIFIEQQLRYLDSIFRYKKPKYILDAGANAGFSTNFFKLLWPDAVVVSVEPNSKNFEALQRNTEAFKGVHPINAGLWGWRARIGLAGSHGEWGYVFQEVGDDEEGMQAYSVADLARMHKIPKFDLVKIDIEGAEGKVFDPKADVKWIKNALAVSLELHDFFAGYFGLKGKDITNRVVKAFKDKAFGMATDNEHTIFVGYKLLSTLI